MDQPPHDADRSAGSADQPRRRYGATRVFPRIEVGRPREAQEESLTPENAGSAPGDPSMGWEMAGQGGGGGGLFAPRTFGGDRVRLYGCSPGCLLVSVLVSLILTLLLNAIV